MERIELGARGSRVALQRPLLGLLAAVAGGTALGGSGPASSRELAALAALVAPALLAAVAIARPPARRVALLAFAALACALRGAAARPAEARGAEGEPPAFVGRWRPESGVADELGSLEGLAERFELPPGAAREGELLLVAPGRASPEPAAGPGGAEPRTGPPLPRPVQRDELVRIAPGPAGALEGLARALAGLRRAGLERLDGLGDPLARGLAAALCFGDRAQLDPELTDLFTRTGTRHALAVSGLHVGLLAWMLVWPLGALLGRAAAALGLGRSARAAAAAFRALLLALIVPMAGGGAPVLRAVLALSLGLLAPSLPARPGARVRRRPDALSLWSLAATLECLADPSALASLSLELSYLATLGLVLASPGAAAWLRSALPHGGILPETWGSGRRVPSALRVPAQRTLDLAVAAAAVSVAANLATLPLVWARFGEWSPVGIIATPLVVPLLALFLGLGWSWLVIPLHGIAAPLALTAHGMVELLARCDALPATPAPLPPRPLALLLAAAAAAVWLLHRAPDPDSAPRATLVRPAAALASWLLFPWSGAPRRLEVFALDVGHGTACVVRAPGARCWLFDAGSRDRPGLARDGLLPLLARLEVGRVAVCLSHAERDHDSALAFVQERYPAELWVGALSAQQSERLPHAGARVDLVRGVAELEDARAAVTPLELRLLRGGDLDGNEGSRNLALAWGDERVLLCGDAEAEGLRAMLGEPALEGPFDLVLEPHHGSDTPLLGRFLERARPARVWISSAEVPALARELERRGIPWSATALEGALVHPPRARADARPVHEAARFVCNGAPHPLDAIRSGPGGEPSLARDGASDVGRELR